jgi:hypothetical protein
MQSFRKDMASLRKRCFEEAERLKRPFTGKPRYDRLRHLYAHAMQIDVIFQPFKGWLPVRDDDGSIHQKTCPARQAGKCYCVAKYPTSMCWRSNPIWVKAPKGALMKARAFCSTLNVLVTHGHVCDLTHELGQLSKVIWKMSQKDFRGLNRRIVAKIANAVRVNGKIVLKSPEPLVRDNGALTKKPGILDTREHWYHSSRARNKSERYIPRYVPPRRRQAILARIREDVKALRARSAKPASGSVHTGQRTVSPRFPREPARP